MAAILARLAQVQREILAESAQRAADMDAETSKPQGEGDGQDKKEAEEQPFIETKREKERVEQHQTKVVQCLPSCLVWARFTIKHASGFFPGRVCDNSEAASFPWVEHPIPEHKVLIEFFNMPEKIAPRFHAVKREDTRPYYEDPSHREGSREHWSREYDERCLEVLTHKFSRRVSETVYAAMRVTADAFLELALTKTDLPVYESAPGGMCEEEDSEQDLSLEAVAARASLMSEETFAAGDWVQYEHPIMKFSVKSRVVEVCPSATLPLVLESDECLARDSFVMRIPAEFAGEVPLDNNFTYRLLGDFLFERSRIEGVETLQTVLRREAEAGRVRLERETGLVLNYRSSSIETASGKKRKEVAVLSDDDNDFVESPERASKPQRPSAGRHSGQRDRLSSTKERSSSTKKKAGRGE